MATNILVCLLGFIIAQVQVAAASLPEPTRRMASLAQAPATTSKPKLPRRLLDRQLAVNTCGYFDADPNQPYTCGVGQDCVSNTIWNIFGCCVTDLAGVPIPASCLQVANPYTSCVEYQSASFCTGACYSYNRVCESTLPYCAIAYSYTGAETYTEYFCQSVAGGTPSLSLFASATSTTPDTITTPDTNSETATVPTTPSTQSTVEPPTSTSPTPITTTPVQPTVVSESKSNVGAIVGGVVGGLAGLGLLVGGGIFFLHRSKKRERNEAFPEVSQI